jgi:ElaB/YqjD/DUF883 family membrane-anchored ribosome-binding protein
MELLPKRCVIVPTYFPLVSEVTMPTHSKVASTAEEIAAIKELMGDLEKRLHRLSGATKREFSGASSEINDFVNDALAGIMERVREGAHSATDKATHLGGDAFKKIAEEVEHRPLTMLAIATGIGFLFGMSRR